MPYIYLDMMVAMTGRASLRALLLTLGIFAAGIGAARAAPSDKVLVVEIDGAISVAAARQLTRVLDEAKKEGAAAIVMRLDTPGGLVSATRDIIRDMIAAPVPIIVYVAPSGARAASAGTFIVYASHLAAMAPGTNLGAATPIQLGSVPGLPSSATKRKAASRAPPSASRSTTPWRSCAAWRNCAGVIPILPKRPCARPRR